MLRRSLPLLLLLAASLSGCDAFYDAIGLNDAKKAEAEAKAIGAACRHAGRSLEDCYALNPNASKSAIFEGWREMNDYMLQNNLREVPPVFAPTEPLKRSQPIIPKPESAPGAPAPGTPPSTAAPLGR
ncbi:hypothetical protein [Tepidiphilus sp. J10]|uniref:hypothetical protein n=1 Tax=Tepidiphilus sp. J10 TaxID=2502185 RepID=UPI00115CC458|nr:hypothetical protein [Tepidiphilus sp. J10]